MPRVGYPLTPILVRVFQSSRTQTAGPPAMPGQGQMPYSCACGLFYKDLTSFNLASSPQLCPPVVRLRPSSSLLSRKTSEPAHLLRYRDVSLYMVRIEGTAEHAHPSSDPPRIALASPSLASVPSDCEPVRGADTCVRIPHVPSDRLNLSHRRLCTWRRPVLHRFARPAPSAGCAAHRRIGARPHAFPTSSK